MTCCPFEIGKLIKEKTHIPFKANLVMVLGIYKRIHQLSNTNNSIS